MNLNELSNKIEQVIDAPTEITEKFKALSDREKLGNDHFDSFDVDRAEIEMLLSNMNESFN